MVAVLDEVATVVDGTDDLLGIATSPAPKFVRCGWNVADTFWAKVADYGVGAGCCRPVGALRSAVDFVDAFWCLAVLGQVATDGRYGNLEPFVVLPSRCCQRMVVIIWVGDHIGVFVFIELAHNDGELRLILDENA